jgi:hypothetical protein
LLILDFLSLTDFRLQNTYCFSLSAILKELNHLATKTPFQGFINIVFRRSARLLSCGW